MECLCAVIQVTLDQLQSDIMTVFVTILRSSLTKLYGHVVDHILYATDFSKLWDHGFWAGRAKPNRSLASKNFTVMMDALREHFDYIIVDAPSNRSVIDAAHYR